MERDIFISYAHKDLSRIKPLITRLKAEGFSVFFDSELTVGSEWRFEISKYLEAVPCIIVVWSNTSVASSNVHDEAETGKGREVLVPIAIDSDIKLPYSFRGLQTRYIVLPGTDADWDIVVSRVRGLVSTAHVKELQHSATPLADIVQDARTSYEAKITAIVDPLRQVASNPDLGQDGISQSLRDALTDMARNDLFSIAVVGRMKAGKSTLLNIFLGLGEDGSKSPLPTEGNACTPTIIRLLYSDTPYCRPYAWDHLHTKRGEAMPDWTIDEFHERARIYDNGTDTKIFDRIAEFEIGWPSYLLQAGVSLVDTPGISETPERTALTRTEVTKNDAAIMMYRSEPFAGEDETKFADDVTVRAGKVFTVINMREDHVIDQMSTFENIARGKLKLEPTLTLKDQDVFCCNLKTALRAMGRQNGRLPKDSELGQLETRLAEFLSTRRYSAHLLKVIRKIGPLGERLYSATDSMIAAARADTVKLREAIADCRKVLARIKQKKSTIDTLFAKFLELAESVAQHSFKAKANEIANCMGSRLPSFDLGIPSSFIGRANASTAQEEKWMKMAVEKIAALVHHDLEEWATAKSDQAGLAQDLKPTIEQLVSSLKVQAEGIADEVNSLRARIFTTDPNVSFDTANSCDSLGIMGIDDLNLELDTIARMINGAGIGIAFTAYLTLIVLSLPVLWPIIIAGGFLGAIFVAAADIEKRVKGKAWSAIEPAVRGMPDDPVTQQQLLIAIRNSFSKFQTTLTEWLAPIISGEDQLLTHLEGLCRDNASKDKLIERLVQHKATIVDALEQAKLLEKELDRTIRTTRS